VGKVVRVGLSGAVSLLLAGVVAGSASATPGDIIVGDSSLGEVLRVKPRTGAIRLISDDSRFVSPNDTVFGPDGMVYVADYEAFDGGGGVFRVNPRNGNTSVVSDDELFDQPDGIAMGPNGDLFVTDITPAEGALFRVRLPGGNTSVASSDPLLDGGPVGVVVPPNGEPIVADDNLVARVNPTTGDATTIVDGDDDLVSGAGLTRAPDGTLYVADAIEGVQAIDPRTREVTDVSGPVPYDGYSMAFDFMGRVLVTNGDFINAVNVRTGGVREIADDFEYIEGMEVEPPRCGGKTATIVGTNRRDVLKGSRFGDVIAGIGAKDTVRGKGGRDVICGGGGPDRINGGAGADRCFGQGGRDRERRC
jgi:streptogramin lyase